jgi:peptidoglycan hydrolase-like protein with peptidoglycan-binding domain
LGPGTPFGTKEQAMSIGTLSPFPLVRKGDRDHPVKALQYLLRARGHGLAVDGIFGPDTDAAVRAFQQQHGLAVDGVVGPKTGAAVRGFQQALHQDIPSVTVDGIVGPVTWRALVSGMLSF